MSNQLATLQQDNSKAISAPIEPLFVTTYKAWLWNYNSPRTRRNYDNVWKSFLEFFSAMTDIAPNQIALDEILQQHIIGYKEFLVQDGKANSTINLHLSAISAFYKWAMKRGELEHNPVDDVKRVKVNPYGKATFLDTDEDEHKKFLAQIDRETLQGKRDYAIMLVMLTTGVRVSAMANAYVRDLEQRGKDWYLNYVNKGGEADSAKLAPNVLNAVILYLHARDGKARKDDKPLFMATPAGQKTIQATGNASGTDTPLTARSIRRLVKKYAKSAGLGNIHPHSLRHTAAMHASKNGTIADVSGFLRHASIRTTAIYLEHVDKGKADTLADDLAADYGI